MLTEMMRIGNAMKFRNIIAGITAENEGSVILFDKFGFKNVGHFHDVGYKFGRYLDVVFLEYIIDTQVEQGNLIPSFKSFAWNDYVYGGTVTNQLNKLYILIKSDSSFLLFNWFRIQECKAMQHLNHHQLTWLVL